MRHESNHHDKSDSGYTLIELIIVVLFAAIAATVIVLIVTALTTEASSTGCQPDRHELQTAVEVYFAQQAVDEIPATGTDADRFERTLAEGGLLRSPSRYHDLTAAGAFTVQEGSPC